MDNNSNNRTYEEITFPILIYNDSSTEFIDNGTGFFINNEGYLVSAGHVVKDRECKHYARINDTNYLINIIYEEYVEQDNQRPPIYKDFFIGKVDYKINRKLTIQFLDKVQIGKRYFACGYSLRKLVVDEQEVISMDELWDNFENEVVVRLPNYYELSYPCINTKIERQLKDKIVEYDNCFALDTEIGTDPVGISGGPIVKNNVIVGMLIARNTCISGNYIKSKLIEHSIIKDDISN